MTEFDFLTKTIKKSLPKIYIGSLLKYSYLPLLYPNLGHKKKSTILFAEDVFRYISEPFVEIVDIPAIADYFLIPHNYFIVRKEFDYLENFFSLAKQHQKKVIVFAYGDSSEEINLENAIIIRTSRYRSELKANELIMPAYSDDLLFDNNIQLRIKTNHPVICFCGWAGFTDFWRWLKFKIKDFPYHFRFDKFRRQGLFFRRQCLKVLTYSSLIKSNFIIRNNYSGYKTTIRLSPERAREEYINNLINCDFALVVKGDGNFSYRFYEALSLGRIPLLLDTECVLPLDDIINYNDFTLMVNYHQINKIDKIVANFYNSLSEEKFQQMQQSARSVFANYLRIDKFFSHLFKEIYKLNND